MASVNTWWLLPISLLTFTQCCAAQGPPSPPSHLQCSRACDETDCSVDIHCIWDESAYPRIPTNYTLSWQSTDGRVNQAFCGPKSNSVILRKDYVIYKHLHVWVQATNHYGFSQAQRLDFLPEDIIQPPPPKFSSSFPDPLEIHWITACNQLHLFERTCEVRYRTEEGRAWLKHENGLQVAYSVTDPNPGTVYEFQVRCHCHVGLVSDWSVIHRIKTEESAPVGEVDVWRDCGIFPASNSCCLTWKGLPLSQAHGVILAYEIKLSYENGSVALVNASTDRPSSQFVSEEEKWCLRSPLKGISSVSVTAFNALGATQPAFLAMPPTGNEGRDGALQLEINEENLTVSWDLPSQFPDRVNKFIVQYKEAGQPAGQGFGWKTVSRNQMATFKGRFKKYTPYQVSLFQVLNTGEVQHILSNIGYFFQKAPPRVPLFTVVSIKEAEATLQWETLPLTQQNGLNLYYQVGVDSQEVQNVSVSRQHRKKSLKLNRLQPAQDYKAWVRAVNAAGPGPSAVVRFKTQRRFVLGIHLVGLVVGVLLATVCISTVCCVCRGKHKTCPLVPWIDRVPDPCNSHIFAGKKQKIDDPLPWLCITIHESQPNISVLEILEIKPNNPDPDMLNDAGASARHLQERQDAVGHRKNDRCDGKDYSKMVDLDEDREDCWSLSEEELCTTLYEKHFLPSAVECGFT